MIYYFYNNTNFVITLNGRSKDETVMAQTVEGSASGNQSIIGTALALSPKSWTKAIITEERPFTKSLYSGQLKSLIEKEYVRVLSEVEYRDECKKAQLESSTGILHQDTSVSSVGIYRKAAEHNEEINKQKKETFALSGLLIENDLDNYEEEQEKTTEKDVEKTTEKKQDNSRLESLENTVKQLADIVGTLAQQINKKPAKKTKKKSRK